MTANVGIIDRVLRIVVGLALIATAVGLFGPSYQTAWGWVGIVPLATGLVSWCPAYTVLGIRTCKLLQRADRRSKSRPPHTHEAR